MELIKDKEILANDISNNYPNLIQSIKSNRDLEREIKGELAKILFNLNGDTMVTPDEMSKFDNISAAQIRYHIEKYERRKHNGRIHHIFVRSSLKVQELYDYLKRQITTN